MTANLKVEARLSPQYRQALDNYMADHCLTNESELLRSAIGQLLIREGYLQVVGGKARAFRYSKSNPKANP